MAGLGTGLSLAGLPERTDRSSALYVLSARTRTRESDLTKPLAPALWKAPRSYTYPVPPLEPLDELDREEFFRLKKVKGAKERQAAAAAAEANGEVKGDDGENSASKDMLGDEEDKDVIF